MLQCKHPTACMLNDSTDDNAPTAAAPEVIANSRTYDGKLADVWSSGVMLYVMLFCEYPFERAEDAGDPHRFQKVQIVSHAHPCKASAAQKRVTQGCGCSNAWRLSMCPYPCHLHILCESCTLLFFCAIRSRRAVRYPPAMMEPVDRGLRGGCARCRCWSASWRLTITSPAASPSVSTAKTCCDTSLWPTLPSAFLLPTFRGTPGALAACSALRCWRH